MNYYTYITINLNNGRYYIGQHRTNNMNDGYMGSGKLLRRAFKKHGMKNFGKLILRYYSSYELMCEDERIMITPELIKDKRCYNIMPGGFGGDTYSSLSKDAKEVFNSISRERGKTNEEIKKTQFQNMSEEKRKSIQQISYNARKANGFGKGMFTKTHEQRLQSSTTRSKWLIVDPDGNEFKSSYEASIAHGQNTKLVMNWAIRGTRGWSRKLK